MTNINSSYIYGNYKAVNVVLLCHFVNENFQCILSTEEFI